MSEKGYSLAHGIGTGDINGDGRIDLLGATGWWEQPATLNKDKTWKYHPVAFRPVRIQGKRYRWSAYGCLRC